jgi:hypothetical protein
MRDAEAMALPAAAAHLSSVGLYPGVEKGA